MKTNIKPKIFSFFVLLILTLSMLFPSIALADETTPPPEETQEPAPPAEETEEPIVQTEETEEPLLPPADTQEPVSSTEEPSMTEETVEDAGTEAPTEEGTPVPTGEAVIEEPASEEEAPEVSVASILEQLPEGTDLVVLDQEGEEEPLVTQEAAETLATGDPYFTRDGVTY
jgi:hypothetical protein